MDVVIFRLYLIPLDEELFIKKWEKLQNFIAKIFEFLTK